MPATRLGLNLCKKATTATRGRGFSLLELVLVVVITATLAGIALPRMTASNERARVEQAAHRVERIIDEARDWARSHASVAEIEIRVTENEIRIKHDGTSQTPEVISGKPYLAEFIKVDFGGDATFEINGWGTLSAGGTIVIRSGSTDHTITIAGPRSEGRVIVGVNIKRPDALEDLVAKMGIKD